MRTQERRYIRSEKMSPGAVSAAGSIENMLTKGYGPMLSAAAIGVVSMLIVSLFCMPWVKRQTVLAKMAAMQQSMLVKQQLSQLIAASNSTLQELRVAIVKSEPVTQQSFNLFAKKLLGRQKYASSLSWSPDQAAAVTYPFSDAEGPIANKLTEDVQEKVKAAAQSLTVKFIAQSRSNGRGVTNFNITYPTVQGGDQQRR